MDDDKICIRSAKCPIYNGILESNEVLIKTYKDLYCENGSKGRENCKRYQVVLIEGSCPPDILPNSDLSVDTIIRLMEASKSKLCSSAPETSLSIYQKICRMQVLKCFRFIAARKRRQKN